MTLLALGGQTQAVTLTAEVTDRSGMPVAEVVVYATPLGAEPTMRAPSQPLVMDQRHEQFAPHILVVQAGSAVAFPNHDTVSHHVYSFSRAKQFELPLYRGTAHPPVVFDRPGVVDLGCNIHDHMEAHIVVVETPYFAMTAVNGRATLTGLPQGEYTVHIYTPRLRADALPAPERIVLEADAVLDIRFDTRLHPPHAIESESLNWSHY